MSNVQLPQANLNAIERQLRELGSLNLQVQQRVDAVKTQQVETDQRLQALSATLHEWIQADRRAKALQLAETRVVKVRQELVTEFGHYGDVRRRATGILQALDAGIVTHETIQTTTEDVMMAAPRYWLAPVLVALAGWSRDDRRLAERALAEALARDTSKASLLMVLTLRRFTRHVASARWLEYYFARQDPAALPREVVILLDAVANGAFGPAAKDAVTTQIGTWLVDLGRTGGFADGQRDRWKAALAGLTPQVRDQGYPHLAAHSPSWPGLKASLGAVRRNAPVIEHFRAIFEGELRVPREIERQIDDMLEQLVTRFDAEELPLRRKEAELQAIIDHDGDSRAAEGSSALKQDVFEETVDFGTLLTNAAMHPQESAASVGTQRLAVAMSRDWILAAHDALVAATRQAKPSAIDVTIDGWKCELHEGEYHASHLTSLAAHMDAKTAAAVEAIKFRGGPLYVAMGSGAALLVGLITVTVPVIVIALIAGACAGWAYSRLGPKCAEAQRVGNKNKERRLEELKACLTEAVDFREEWHEEDSRAEDARDLLLAVSTSDYEMSRPDETRMVLQ